MGHGNYSRIFSKVLQSSNSVGDDVGFIAGYSVRCNVDYEVIAVIQ